MREATQNYFEYVEKVLGVKSLLLDQVTQTDLLFCIQNLATYSEAEKELLHKMISAIKLDSEQTKCCDLSQRNQFQARLAMLLIDDWAPQNTLNSDILSAFSPRILLKKPELKKLAWAELQKIPLFFHVSK